MKHTQKTIGAVLAAIILGGCAVVDVTKTAAGFHNPTNPNTVQIRFFA